ncbi:MAG: tetratricopeptide repeat protein, partial [Proteobacteria bacterium]|nr:tetratricopeptide repeat protein [Pseudomonadota bacterium]
MGLLDKIFHRDWEYYLTKCQKFLDSGDLGEAHSCIKKAKELAADNNEKGDFKSQANEKIAEKETIVCHQIYERAYKQAKELLRSGQSESAKNALERAAKFVRTDEERDALNQLVEDSQHMNDDDKIVEAHVAGEERVDGLNTSDKWNLYVTSLPFEKAQHYDELGDEFKEAWISLQEGDFDTAIKGLEDAYKDHPDDGFVMTELGRAYYGKGTFEKAYDMLKKADEARDDIETKLLRTELLWTMKKFDEAENVLQAAHDLDPENITVLARIAQHGLIARDFESGIAAVEVLLEKIPNDWSVQRLAGRIYLESGDEDKALECFEAVNRIYWQVNPQTKKLSFDQTSASAAGNIYLKRGEKLERAAELFEAIRANSEGETHVAICQTLAEVYEKQGRNAKRNEVLTESTRFMDDLLQKAKGPERAMIQLQYSEVCDKLGNHDKENEMIQSARSFFAQDAEKGQPIAEFYLELIDKKLAGEPFPTNDKMEERLKDFIQRKREAAQSAQQNAGNNLLYTMASMANSPVNTQDNDSEDDDGESDAPQNTLSAAEQNAAANDILRAMASMMPSMQINEVIPESDESDEDNTDSEEEKS